MGHMDPHNFVPKSSPPPSASQAHSDLRPDAARVRADAAMREMKLQAFEKYNVKYLGAGEVSKKAEKVGYTWGGGLVSGREILTPSNNTV